MHSTYVRCNQHDQESRIQYHELAWHAAGRVIYRQYILPISGINDAKPMSGAHLPHHHGFDWVGHNLPYSYAWECDENKVTN